MLASIRPTLRQASLLLKEKIAFSGIRYKKSIELPNLKIKKKYYVSSEKGVYLLENKKLTRIYPLWTMGLTVESDNIFFATSNEKRSYILKTNRYELEQNHFTLPKLSELYRVKMNSSNERIHQISIIEDALWVANTARNTLLVIDHRTGQKIKEIAPFTDPFGEPIFCDQNHINSISAAGNCILFVCYKAGSGSLLCILHEDTVFGFRYKNCGVHDIHLKDRSILYSDTFGESKLNQTGFLMRDMNPIDHQYFSKPPGYIVRGMAGNKKEMLIGHSFKGVRAERFKGKGSLLLLNDEKVTQEFPMPFAQFYDIIQTDGKTFDEAPALINFEEIYTHFEKVFGQPIIKQAITYV